jgi:outer membrane lipoprotein
MKVPGIRRNLEANSAVRGAMMAKWFFPVSIFFLASSACAPVISKQSLSQADMNVTFQELQKDPERYGGKVVLLGGQILGTNAQEGQTWIEVLQKPLGSRQRPKDTDLSYGRFLIRFPDFRDPAIYAPGRLITVLGEVQGGHLSPLSRTTYNYPVLVPREAHLWRPEEPGAGPLINFGFGIGGVFH